MPLNNLTLNVINEDEEYALNVSDNGNKCPDKEQQTLRYVEAEPSDSDMLDLGSRLLDEFDSLGVCRETFNSDIQNFYSELIIGGFTLVNKYRQLLTELKDNRATIIRLKEENYKLHKQISGLKENLKVKDDKIVSINQKVALKDMDCDHLHKKILNLHKELNGYKNVLNSKEDEWQHKLKQLEIQNSHLKTVAENNAGSFTSKDLITASIIKKYKNNEESYKTLIKKLQDNNQDLLKQLLLLIQNPQSEAS